MPFKGFKPILTVAFLMAISCLVKLTVCKSIDEGFEIETLSKAIAAKAARGENLHRGARVSKTISDDEFEIGPLDEAVESKPAANEENPNETQRHSKRLAENEFIKEPSAEALNEPKLTEREETSNDSQARQNILNKCFSAGSIEETLKSLGVLDLPGVRLVKVEGELYEKLLRNKTVVEPKPAANVIRDQTVSKRTELIDMCEEVYDYTYILVHASGQTAYQVDTVVCQDTYCQSSTLQTLAQGNIGECILEEKTMLVYVMDSSGNFHPQTLNIGCACKCMAYP